MVIDCGASYVGVEHETSVPKGGDSDVNGATIDLSLTLWNFLYNSAEPAVYDIEYNTSTYSGAGVELKPLQSLICEKRNA